MLVHDWRVAYKKYYGEPHWPITHAGNYEGDSAPCARDARETLRLQTACRARVGTCRPV